MGNRGAEALFLALTSSGSTSESESKGHGGAVFADLRNLDLAGQGLGNEAASALATLLPLCPRLTVLDISRNHISETGAHSIVTEVIKHQGLVRVNMEGNPVPSHLRLRLKDTLAARNKDASEPASPKSPASPRLPKLGGQEWTSKGSRR